MFVLNVNKVGEEMAFLLIFKLLLSITTCRKGNVLPHGGYTSVLVDGAKSIAGAREPRDLATQSGTSCEIPYRSTH